MTTLGARTLLVLLLLAGAPVVSAAPPATCAIGQGYYDIANGVTTFYVCAGTNTWQTPTQAFSIAQTTSNPSISVYAGVTAPRTYYVNFLNSATLTLANSVPRATGLANYLYYAPTDSDASGIQRFSELNYLQTGGTQNLSSTLIASFNRTVHYGTGSVPTIYGGYFDAFNGHAGEQATTGGNVTNLYGIQTAVIGQSSNSSIGTEYGVYTNVENDYGTGVTTAYGHRVDFTGAVIPTTSYGFYANNVIGTTKYSFYSADATAPSHFAGSIDTPVVNATTAFQVNGTAITSGTTVLSSGSGMAVANVGANSCGTSAASIVGNNNLFTITVGATAGTQCRVTFTITATTAWGCTANDDTTTVAVRTTPVDTTHLDLIGTFTAGDQVTAICLPR